MRTHSALTQGKVFGGGRRQDLGSELCRGTTLPMGFAFPEELQEYQEYWEYREYPLGWSPAAALGASPAQPVLSSQRWDALELCCYLGSRFPPHTQHS